MKKCSRFPLRAHAKAVKYSPFKFWERVSVSEFPTNFYGQIEKIETQGKGCKSNEAQGVQTRRARRAYCFEEAR